MSTASSQDTAARLVATSPPSPSVFAEGVTSLDLIRRARSPQIRAAVLVALGYYVGAKIGFALALDPSSVPILWPPTPILLAGLLLTPVRSWAVVFAATFAAHLVAQLQGGVPPAMILSTYVSSSAGALVGAVTFRRLHTEAPRLDTLRETVILLLCAGFLAPFVSSFLDLALNGWGHADDWTNWRTRFFSNALSELTIVPLIVTTASSLSGARQAPRRKWLEAVVIFSLLLAASWFVFVRARTAPGSFPALFYVPFPLLAAAAVRLGPWGASTSVMACALVAIWGAVQGHGPFVASSAAENALTIQVFLIIASVSVMSLAALTEDRARAESKARRSEEQLAIALDAAQLGRWDWDIAQQRLEWSDITRRMYGVPLDVPVSIETYAALIHPDDRQAIEAATQDGLAGRPIDVEFRIVLPDGTVKWILSRGKTLFDAEGRATRMVGIKVDITSRKQTELQLKEQGRELAHIDRLSMVGELSVAIAHELNQPLAAILANVGAARRFLSHSPPNIGQVREIVEAIGQDNRRAADVIRKVGALLRRDDLPRATLQLNDVVEDVIDIARADIIGRGVSLSIRCDRGLAPIAGDRVQLQQVLLNLVLNACDAMDSVPETARRLTIVTSGGPEAPRACDGLRYRARRRRSSTQSRVRAFRDVQATRPRPRPRRLPVDRHRARGHALGREQPGRRRVLLLRAAVPGQRAGGIGHDFEGVGYDDATERIGRSYCTQSAMKTLVSRRCRRQGWWTRFSPVGSQ